MDDPGQEALVALAHDVFNAGVSLTWEANHAQIRRFRSIPQWTEYLEAAGFSTSGRSQAQAHDPTRNLLLEFVKT